MKIYAYELKAYPGLIKVGQTTREDVEQRIREQYKNYPPFYEKNSNELNIKLVEEVSFQDHDVHKTLSEMGIERVGGEWFRCSTEEVKDAIERVKDKIESTSGNKIELRKRIELTESALEQYVQREPKNRILFYKEEDLEFFKLPIIKLPYVQNKYKPRELSKLFDDLKDYSDIPVALLFKISAEVLWEAPNFKDVILASLYPLGDGLDTKEFQNQVIKEFHKLFVAVDRKALKKLIKSGIDYLEQYSMLGEPYEDYRNEYENIWNIRNNYYLSNEISLKYLIKHNIINLY